MVMEDLLARAGVLQLGRRSAYLCWAAGAGVDEDIARDAREDFALRLVLGSNVGCRRIALWTWCALSRDCARIYNRTRVQYSVRDTGATALRRSAWSYCSGACRTSDSVWRCDLRNGDWNDRRGGVDEGTRAGGIDCGGCSITRRDGRVFV